MNAMDFQIKTAERILEIFAAPNRQGQKRVLLSDEVGLGKTIMAREVINRVGELRKKLNDDDYRIVYVCSNQNIIQQNIEKLVDIADKDDDKVLKISDSRLSMQHLVLEERMERLRNDEDYAEYLRQVRAADISRVFICGVGEIKAEKGILFEEPQI